jgi:hypothetical protein
MPSLLNHSRLKLWVWVVIIVAASVVLLSTLFLGMWCWARRRRVRKKTLPSPMLAPTRKVTIRRGRMVSSSRYLSLTGSKFGLGQFMNMEEKEQGDKGRSRSKSPFMWWLANSQDRSQSRQSHMSSQPQMDEAHNQYYQKPEPAFFNRHAHNESVASDYSLPSIINGRELADDARTNSAQAGASLDSPHSSRYVNFSRAFPPLRQSALLSPSAPNKALSQIVEMSPRHSAASKQPSMISMSEVVVVENENILAPPSVPPHLPVPALRSLQNSPSPPPKPFVRRYSGQNMTSRLPSTTKTSLSLSTVDQSRTPSVPAVAHLPDSPRSGPLPYWRPQPGEGMPGPNVVVRSVSSAETQHPSPETLSRHHDDGEDDDDNNNNPRNSSTEDVSSNAHSVAYWRSRPDLQSALKPSKKGNVLKKKSIRRAEIVSLVGN